MKKVLFIALAMVFSLSLNAKSELLYDKVFDNVRIIETCVSNHAFPCKEVSSDCGVSMKCAKDTSTNQVEYWICITIYNGKWLIAQGNKLLLKLKTNEIITLSASDNYEASIEPRLSSLLNNTTTTLTPYYKISRQDLDKILMSDVVKVRVETYYSYFDGELTPLYGNNFSKSIRDDFMLISSELKKEKSIYDGF